MSSIIEGYNYDIFISYRQKDNKHDGWVTEFVNQLKGELEATFKEDISIYFDENPHDGLLETHSVDKSLEGKLKCLIFIPIISQTYCDFKSFAWQHEFCAFNKLAKEDKFGRDIRLAGGNVSSRILPVKIHDLDPEDKTLLENELGGVLRSVDFIYKSAGVNRPLRANEDHPQDNLNKTYYRDQINKVANAIKEIISALKKQSQHPEEVSKQNMELKSAPHKSTRTKIIAGSLIVLALLVLGYFLIPKQSNSSRPIEKSIAVLPFRNDSQNEENTYFINGIMEEVLNNLQKIKDFRVLSRTSVEQYRGLAKSSLPKIAKELNVNYIVEGSGQKYGNKFVLRVQLIAAKNERHLWGESYEQEILETNDIIKIQNQIAQAIAKELKAVITPEEKQLIEKRPTENLEAYNYYLKGNEFYWQSNNESPLNQAIGMYEKAIELDPNFALAYAKLSISHSRRFLFDKNNERLLRSKAAIDSAFKIDPDLPEAHLALGAYYYNTALDYPKALEQIDIAEKQLPNNSECTYWKTAICRRSGSWKLAKIYAIKSFELDPGSAVVANQTGQTLDRMREYPDAEFYYRKSISNNPSYTDPYGGLFNMYLRWKGNTIKAREVLDEGVKSFGPETERGILSYRALLELYDGNYEKALAYLTKMDNDSTTSAKINYNTSLSFAGVYNLLNQPFKAHPYFDTARKLLESAIAKYPYSQTLIGNLGIAYAGLGQKKKAIEVGKKTVELLPLSKDAFAGSYGIEFLAQIYVMTGEYDAALEQIKFLLSVPSRLTPQILLLNPIWKPLWDLPEFKEIINTGLVNAKYN